MPKQDFKNISFGGKQYRVYLDGTVEVRKRRRWTPENDDVIISRVMDNGGSKWIRQNTKGNAANDEGWVSGSTRGKKPYRYRTLEDGSIIVETNPGDTFFGGDQTTFIVDPTGEIVTNYSRYADTEGLPADAKGIASAIGAAVSSSDSAKKSLQWNPIRDDILADFDKKVSDISNKVRAGDMTAAEANEALIDAGVHPAYVANSNQIFNQFLTEEIDLDTFRDSYDPTQEYGDGDTFLYDGKRLVKTDKTYGYGKSSYEILMDADGNYYKRAKRDGDISVFKDRNKISRWNNEGLLSKYEGDLAPETSEETEVGTTASRETRETGDPEVDFQRMEEDVAKWREAGLSEPQIQAELERLYPESFGHQNWMTNEGADEMDKIIADLKNAEDTQAAAEAAAALAEAKRRIQAAEAAQSVLDSANIQQDVDKNKKVQDVKNKITEAEREEALKQTDFETAPSPTTALDEEDYVPLPISPEQDFATPSPSPVLGDEDYVPLPIAPEVDTPVPPPAPIVGDEDYVPLPLPSIGDEAVTPSVVPQGGDEEEAIFIDPQVARDARNREAARTEYTGPLDPTTAKTGHGRSPLEIAATAEQDRLDQIPGDTQEGSIYGDVPVTPGPDVSPVTPTGGEGLGDITRPIEAIPGAGTRGYETAGERDQYAQQQRDIAEAAARRNAQSLIAEAEAETRRVDALPGFGDPGVTGDTGVSVPTTPGEVPPLPTPTGGEGLGEAPGVYVEESPYGISSFTERGRGEISYPEREAPVEETVDITTPTGKPTAEEYHKFHGNYVTDSDGDVVRDGSGKPVLAPKLTGALPGSFDRRYPKGTPLRNPRTGQVFFNGGEEIGFGNIPADAPTDTIINAVLSDTASDLTEDQINNRARLLGLSN